MRFARDLDDVYNQIVYWKKNLFYLPSSHSGKQYIREQTTLLNAWTFDSPLKFVALKGIHVMPTILLQKPNKKSKLKDHMKALERRLKLWDEGNLLELFAQSKTIQDYLKTRTPTGEISDIARKLLMLMQKGDVNAPLKLLANNMNNGILPLNGDTPIVLDQKHHDAKEYMNNRSTVEKNSSHFYDVIQ